jgi:hypothetical protein
MNKALVMVPDEFKNMWLNINKFLPSFKKFYSGKGWETYSKTKDSYIKVILLRIN